MYSHSKNNNSKILRIAYTTPWRTVHPALQHTLIGDLLLSNQYSSLVGVNDAGVSIPLAAKSWIISEDFKTFRFAIDQTQTFPDGSRLTAQDFKRSWERALTLKPISANNSLLDILYKVEGYQEFSTTKSLSGVQPIDESTLEVRFSAPFRMALEHLQGKRFAAFKENDQKPFGTGNFVIEEIGKDKVLLSPRKDLEGNDKLPTFEVSLLDQDNEVELLYSGKIDVLPFVTAIAIDLAAVDSEQVGSVVGHDALNIAFGLNNLPNSVFGDVRCRRALQYLLFKDAETLNNSVPSEPYFQTDPQHFLPLQMGRLEKAEVSELIKGGREFVDLLVTKTKNKPIKVVGPRAYLPLINLLKNLGLTLTTDSGEISVEEYISLAYQENGPDILIGAYSVASGDPDGLYHALGMNGAIKIPYVYNEKVGVELERGRGLIGSESIHDFYQNVSRTLLTEVPQIHIGFAKALLLYRKKTVEVDSSILKRNQGQLHFLRAK